MFSSGSWNETGIFTDKNAVATTDQTRKKKVPFKQKHVDNKCIKIYISTRTRLQDVHLKVPGLIWRGNPIRT